MWFDRFTTNGIRERKNYMRKGGKVLLGEGLEVEAVVFDDEVG